MNKMGYLFTSESVTEGHPDKIADQISDAVLDAVFADDERGRVACETMISTGLVVVSGEITTSTYVDITGIVREVIRGIGYNRAKYGFDCDTCGVVLAINKQSPDIAMGVDTGGAGDQGMMFGFACNETPELMPMPITLAHKMSMKLTEVRKSGLLDYLRPDGKTQVTVRYEGFRPVGIDAVVVSSQHSKRIDMDGLRADIAEHVINPILPPEIDTGQMNCYINPTGRFVIGGPMGDCGLTGRKIIVDTYGGMGRHGGGAFSGKDPSKVDRSAAYAARWVAKNIVAASLAERIEVQLAYAIGVAEPVSIMVNTFGTSSLPEDVIVKIIRNEFDLTPNGIINTLELRKPIYQKTAAYGHFGREQFSWEKTNRVDELLKAAGKYGA